MRAIPRLTRMRAIPRPTAPGRAARLGLYRARRIRVRGVPSGGRISAIKRAEPGFGTGPGRVRLGPGNRSAEFAWRMDSTRERKPGGHGDCGWRANMQAGPPIGRGVRRTAAPRAPSPLLFSCGAAHQLRCDWRIAASAELCGPLLLRM